GPAQHPAWRDRRARRRRSNGGGSDALSGRPGPVSMTVPLRRTGRLAAAVMTLTSATFLGRPAFAEHVLRREGQAMGTIVSFAAWTGNDTLAERAFQAGFAEIQRIELLMTDWERPGVPPSDVVRINRAAGKDSVKVAPETLEVIRASLAM